MGGRSGEKRESVLRTKLTTKACKNDLLHCLKTYLFAAAFSSWLSLLFSFLFFCFNFVPSRLAGSLRFSFSVVHSSTQHDDDILPLFVLAEHSYMCFVFGGEAGEGCTYRSIWWPIWLWRLFLKSVLSDRMQCVYVCFCKTVRIFERSCECVCVCVQM